MKDVIAFDSPLLRTLAKEVGGKTKLLDAWSNRFPKREPPSPSSIKRWLAGGFPDNISRVLQLAAILEVDPFCLLAPRTGTVETTINAVFRSLKEQDSASELLQFLKTMFGWQIEWPPKHWQNGQTTHPFSWHVREFSHDPTIRQDFYKQIALVSESELISTRPQTFHFAYSGAGLLSTAFWLNYGVVVRDFDDVRLVHMHGHTGRYTTEELAAPSFVETHFGPGAANFRVASLHPFALDLNPPERPSERCVRFPG